MKHFATSLVLTAALAALMHASRADAADWWQQNLRFTIDASTRSTLSTERQVVSGTNALGFDLHKVFGGASGDWGTATLQGYLTALEDEAARPPFFEDDDDWEFVYRIFNFNYTALARGRFNVRVGRIETPYGVEFPINTNGTLRQFLHGPNLGLKGDWGASINGVFPWFEYEVALLRGIADESKAGPARVVVGRFGTPAEESLVAGLSFFHGYLSNPGAVGLWRLGETNAVELARVDNLVRRTRFGLDVEWYAGPFEILSELNYGRDFDQAVGTGLVELAWLSPAEAWRVYTQTVGRFREWDTGWVDQVGVVGGVRWAPDEHWALSADLNQELSKFTKADRDSVVRVQLRYRF